MRRGIYELGGIIALICDYKDHSKGEPEPESEPGLIIIAMVFLLLRNGRELAESDIHGGFLICLLFTICYLLFVICYLLFAVYST